MLSCGGSSMIQSMISSLICQALIPIAPSPHPMAVPAMAVPAMAPGWIAQTMPSQLLTLWESICFILLAALCHSNELGRACIQNMAGSSAKCVSPAFGLCSGWRCTGRAHGCRSEASSAGQQRAARPGKDLMLLSGRLLIDVCSW